MAWSSFVDKRQLLALKWIWFWMTLWTIRVTSRIFSIHVNDSNFLQRQNPRPIRDKWRLDSTGSKKPIKLELSDSLNDEENLLCFESNNFEQFLSSDHGYFVFINSPVQGTGSILRDRRLVLWYFLIARHSTLMFGDFFE